MFIHESIITGIPIIVVDKRNRIIFLSLSVTVSFITSMRPIITPMNIQEHIDTVVNTVLSILRIPNQSAQLTNIVIVIAKLVQRYGSIFSEKYLDLSQC